MISKKPLKTFLFPVANIIFGIYLLTAFYSADKIVIRTFPCAQLAALKFLVPQPGDYLWKVSINNAPIIKGQMLFYKDYYEFLLQIYPCLWDAYGIIGYCYHYLGDDAKAVYYLKMAIQCNPLFTWNYYNLAAIYISEARYNEAIGLLQQLQGLDPQKSIQRMFASQDVYGPLLDAGGKDAIQITAKHLKTSYKASYDMIQLLTQVPTNSEIEKIIRNVKLELYAF